MRRRIGRPVCPNPAGAFGIRGRVHQAVHRGPDYGRVTGPRGYTDRWRAGPLHLPHAQGLHPDRLQNKGLSGQRAGLDGFGALRYPRQVAERRTPRSGYGDAANPAGAALSVENAPRFEGVLRLCRGRRQGRVETAGVAARSGTRRGQRQGSQRFRRGWRAGHHGQIRQGGLFLARRQQVRSQEADHGATGRFGRPVHGAPGGGHDGS